MSRIFELKLTEALKDAPPHLLYAKPRTKPAGFPYEVVSPIFPVYTSAPIPLATYLRGLGYSARPVPYPAVPRGQERIRIVVHARNTEAEFDQFLAHIKTWALVVMSEQEGIVNGAKSTDQTFPGTLGGSVEQEQTDDTVRGAGASVKSTLFR